MANGWDESAAAWIADMGEAGDFGRRYVLDPVMIERALRARPANTLDVGCGEGRFCRMLRARGVEAIGIDPTRALIDVARARDAEGRYVYGRAEDLPFAEQCFDLVVSYLSLIDIPDFALALAEMARVLKRGGRLLIANLNGFNTAGQELGWAHDDRGARLHFRIDNYLTPSAAWIEYRAIRILNHHRPLSAYMRQLLELGLTLEYFDEPHPMAGAPERARDYIRAPWFLVMEWSKP